VNRPGGGSVPRTQAGAALLIALVVAAIAAAVATTLAAGTMRWGAIVEGRRDHARAVSLATAGVQWAIGVIADDARRGPLDHAGEPWAVPLPSTPVEGGSVEGRIVDAQARFNVNALAGADVAGLATRARFERLLARRGVDSALADAIADWIDRDGNVRGRGAEDAAYAATRRLAPNAEMTRAAEIALVRGGDAWPRIAADVVALPADAGLNVNTASAEMLGTLMPDLDADRLASLLASRASRPFESLEDFRSRARAAGYDDVATDGLAVGSRHFLVEVRATQGHAVARAQALVSRRDGRPPTVAWQIVE